MEEESYLILTVILMAVVTYIPRVLPLQIPSHYWPRWIKQIIEYLPVAIVGAITVPELLMEKQSISLLNPGSLAAIPTLLVAYYSRNLMLSVVVGTLIYSVSNRWLF